MATSCGAGSAAADPRQRYSSRVAFSDLWRDLRDAADILRHARGVTEVVRAVLPASLRERRVLNRGDGALEDATPRPSLASPLAQTLRALGGALRADAVDDEGRVHYGRLRGSAAYAELCRESARLVAVTPDDLPTDAARGAFWINLYNVLSIHGVIALGIERSVMELPSFFSRVAYDVGGETFTPDEIENGVLRRNAPHPATGERLFAPDDARLAYCPTEVDARIHAALVCASKSCPPVRFYTPEALDDELGRAIAGYVAAEVEVRDDALVLPITFRYYARDFGDLRAFLRRHAEGDQRAAIDAAFARGARLEYRRYDWSLNQA